MPTLADYQSGALLASMGRWQPVVTLGLVNVTSKVVGDIEVTLEEGAARIARFTVRPDLGSSISLPSWTGKAVSIAIAAVDASGTPVFPLTIFNGVVDVPAYDPASKLVTVTATDDLQGVCAALSDSAIDLLIGGRWSPVIFDADTSHGWQRCQDELATVPASLDLDVNRTPRVTPWAAKASPDFVFGANLWEDGSLTVETAPRSALINRVNIGFTYRYQLFRSIGLHLAHDITAPGGFAAFAQALGVFLYRSQVPEALKAAGVYAISPIAYTALPTSAVALPAGGYWTPNSTIDPYLCTAFAVDVAYDWAQTRDEIQAITVVAPNSVSQLGTQASSLTGSLQAEQQDGESWETRRWSETSGTKAEYSDTQVASVSAGSIAAIVPAASTQTDRAAADAATQVLIDQAKALIAGSHRQNRIGFTLPLHPVLDVIHTLSLSGPGVSAKGKVVRLVHRLSPEMGRAVTEVSLAISSLGGTGLSHPSTPTTAPAAAAVTPAAHSLTPTITYDSAIGSADHDLVITIPGIAAGYRDPETVTVATTYNAPIVEDVFTVTV